MPDARSQYQHARARVLGALEGVPVAERLRGRGVNFSAHLRSGDGPSPQVFTAHPRVNASSSINRDEVGLQAAAPGLPTRVPVAGWDGESSAQAPAITKTI